MGLFRSRPRPDSEIVEYARMVADAAVDTLQDRMEQLLEVATWHHLYGEGRHDRAWEECSSGTCQRLYRVLMEYRQEGS